MLNSAKHCEKVRSLRLKKGPKEKKKGGPTLIWTVPRRVTRGGILKRVKKVGNQCGTSEKPPIKNQRLIEAVAGKVFSVVQGKSVLF